MPRSLISKATLRTLQRISERAMQTPATIRRSVRPTDAGGAPVADVPQDTALLCSFWARSPGQVGSDDAASRRVPRGEYGCEFPLDTPVSLGDEVIVGGRMLVVVWAPPADAYAVSVLVGLSEHPPEA
jgi:hypothetical protein